MEPSNVSDPRAIVSTIDQKAMRLSALLREIDNHPIEIEPLVKEHLDDTLRMLEFRIAATLALLHHKDEVPATR